MDIVVLFNFDDFISDDVNMIGLRNKLATALNRKRKILRQLEGLGLTLAVQSWTVSRVLVGGAGMFAF